MFSANLHATHLSPKACFCHCFLHLPNPQFCIMHHKDGLPYAWGFPLTVGCLLSRHLICITIFPFLCVCHFRKENLCDSPTVALLYLCLIFFLSKSNRPLIAYYPCLMLPVIFFRCLNFNHANPVLILGWGIYYTLFTLLPP